MLKIVNTIRWHPYVSQALLLALRDYHNSGCTGALLHVLLPRIMLIKVLPQKERIHAFRSFKFHERHQLMLQILAYIIML